MIKQQATVVEVDDDIVWLAAQRQSTCSQCQVKSGCGTGLLEKHVGKRFSRIAVEKKNDVVIGQQVELGIPEESLLQGAFLMYIMPLILLFVFSGIAQLFHWNEFIEIMAGISGLMVGFYLLHKRFKKNKTALKAKIVEE